MFEKIKKIFCGGRLPLVYVDDKGRVEITSKFIKERQSQIRGIMISEDLELEIEAVACVKYANAVRIAQKRQAELLSVEHWNLYMAKKDDFNDTVCNLQRRGVTKAMTLDQVDLTWCREHDNINYTAKGIVFGIDDGIVREVFQFMPAFLRLQHKH